jgi:hypothetical protein
MKYKVYLEQEYKDFNSGLEPDWEIECDPIMLDYELREFCEYLYDNCDGWEWMKNSDERIIAIDESGEMSYYVFELDYEPVFYVSESRETK